MTMAAPNDLSQSNFFGDSTGVQTQDWPVKDISEVGVNDVLYGRGGGTNHHAGNKRFRKMVKERQLEYIGSSRLQKPMIALEIVKEWRNQSPMGRFLRLDKNGLYFDVGDKKAREKTSQALREKAPEIREGLQKGKHITDESSPPKEDVVEEEESGKTKSASEPNEPIPPAPVVPKSGMNLLNDERPVVSFQPLNAGDLDNFKCDLDRIPSIGSEGGRFTSLGSFGFEKDGDLMPPPQQMVGSALAVPPTPSMPAVPKAQSLILKDHTLGELSLDGENIMKLLEDETHEIGEILQIEGMKRETSHNIGAPPKKAMQWSRDRSAAAARLKQDQQDIDFLSTSMERNVSITQTEMPPPPPPQQQQQQMLTASKGPSVESQLASLQEKIKQLEQEIADKNATEQQKQQQTQTNAVPI